MRNVILGLLTVASLALGGCTENGGNPEPSREAKRAELKDEAQSALRTMTDKDAGLQNLLNNAYGYAIFPSVGKGGFIVGAAYGDGLVYEKGQLAGYAKFKQGSIGATIGGETFAELLVFQNADAMSTLKAGAFEVGASATAVALKSGVAQGAQFQNGLLVIVMPRGGAMADASISGQKIEFKRMNNDQPAQP